MLRGLNVRSQFCYIYSDVIFLEHERKPGNILTEICTFPKKL